MEEVKVWLVEDDQAKPLDAAGKMEAEKQLETILVKDPSILMKGLSLIGRQTPAQGGNALDLVGVDTEGKLVVFELKRGMLTRDAVAQVVDYTSYLNSLSLDNLSSLIENNSGNLGIPKIESFNEWYGNLFPDRSIDSLPPLRMVLVGLGSDDKAKRMVDFLSNCGADISLITFHAFELGGRVVLAKSGEVDDTTHGGGPSKGKSDRIRRKELFRIYDDRAKELDLFELVCAVRKMLEECLNRPSENPVVKSRFRTSFYMRAKSGASPAYSFIELNEDPKGIRLGFYPRGIDLVQGEFKKLEQENFPFIYQPVVNAQSTETVDHETIVHLSSISDWEPHRDKLTSLTQKMYQAWCTWDQDEIN